MAGTPKAMLRNVNGQAMCSHKLEKNEAGNRKQVMSKTLIQSYIQSADNSSIDSSQTLRWSKTS